MTINNKRISIIIGLGICVLSICLITECNKDGPPIPSPNTILDTGGYLAALDNCIIQGKDAGSLEVYEQCAKRADEKYGRKTQ